MVTGARQVISPIIYIIRAPTQTPLHWISSPVPSLQSGQIPREETEEQVSEEKVQHPCSQSIQQTGMLIAGTVPPPTPSFLCTFSVGGVAEGVL